MTELFVDATDAALKQVRRDKRRWAVVVSSLMILGLILTGLAIATYVNSRADIARQQSLDDLARLCREGIIDCRGSTGLPGPKSEPGASVTDIDCRRGQFVFTLSNGKIFRVGDCIAEAGPRGREGDRGPRGFIGPRGHRGEHGPPGKPGRPGKTPNLPNIPGLGLGLD